MTEYSNSAVLVADQVKSVVVTLSGINTFLLSQTDNTSTSETNKQIWIDE